MKDAKDTLRIAALFGMLAVILGALGAHALEGKISASALNSFETAVRYQAWHTLALLFLSLAFERLKRARVIAILWVAGTLLFSGSIYLLSLREITHWDIGWLGPVTPVGGLLFIAGWALLLIDSLQSAKYDG